MIARTLLLLTALPAAAQDGALHLSPEEREVIDASIDRAAVWLLERVNENLESVGVPRYAGGVEVMHFLWLVAGESFDTLATVAHKGLRGLKIAPFYGCQILRPSKLLGFDDPNKPDSLERIITACGGDPVDSHHAQLSSCLSCW